MKTPKINLLMVLCLWQMLPYVETNLVAATTADQRERVTISKSFAAALMDKKVQLFYPLLDIESFVNNSLRSKNLNANIRGQYRDDIIRGLTDLPLILMSKLARSGRAVFLRLVQRDNELRGLIRMDYQQHGVSYIELFIHKKQSGVYKIYDYYDYSLGRRYTKIVNQMLLDNQTQARDNPYPSIYSMVSGIKSNQLKYQKMIKLYRTHEYKKALIVMKILSKTYRSTRDALLLRMQIAQAVSHSEYREVLQLLAKNYSQFDNLGLLIIDHYLYSKQYLKAHKAVERFSDYIGADIGLENIKVKLYLAESKFAFAINRAESAIKKDTSYEAIYWSLLKAYLAVYRFELVGSVLNTLENNFNHTIDPDELVKSDNYKEYGLSQFFNTWKRSRTQKE